MVFEELFFFGSILLWAIVRGYQPDIHGLEKYMDFGFINSILRSSYFPPQDIWFPPFSINYYYFGHLVTAVLTQLVNISSYYTFNLMLATIFACTTVGSFSIALTLLAKCVITKNVSTKKFHILLKQTKSETIAYPIAIVGAIFSSILISFGGNLHTIYMFFKPYQTDNPVPFWTLPFSGNLFTGSYWYPNATRFIYNTIHEFPLYSFVVSDLHGHVLDIPFVLLTIAVFLSITLQKTKFKILSIPFLLSVMYMTNASDGVIYFLFAGLLLVCLEYKEIYIDKKFKLPFTELLLKKPHRQKIKDQALGTFLFTIASYVAIIGIGYTIFSLPFNHFFAPFISGIGILCAPSFLTQLGHIGPLLFEPNHCQRSYWWELLTLYGFFYFWVISYAVMILVRNRRELKLSTGDFFIFLLTFIATVLIIIPEFIYFKDIYPAHYRANTMFKLVYQSFIMLSLVSGYCIVKLTLVIFHIRLSVRSIATRILLLPWLAIACFFLFLVFVYPYFAIKSYYGDLKKYQGLDGFSYFRTLYPSDYTAILWLNTYIAGQPVILEAQGDSYTDYARVSANTGLPTVLGWTVHEWLWRKTYDVPAPRIGDVQTLYETEDLQKTKELLKKYDIQYVFIGNLEREKYPNLFETKFSQLGKQIYNNDTTRIYQIDPLTSGKQ